MRNVLFIVFEFPPVQTTGGIRPLKFAKYLPEFGYNPIIIAPDLPSGKRAFPYAHMEEALLKDIEGIEVHRVPVKDYSVFYSNKFLNILYHYFYVGDLHGSFWKKNVLETVKKIFSEKKIEAVYVCCPPFSTAAIGREISRRTRKPWLLDMRDHWSLWSTSAYISRWHYFRNYRKEKRAFKSAARVISVTRNVINDFEHDHPELPAYKWDVIPNGFEEERLDYQPLKVDFSTQPVVKIGYMGEFYYSPRAHETMFTPWYKKKWNRVFQYSPRKEDYKYRSPYYFLRSLKHYFDLHPEMKDKVFFHYIGSPHDWLKDMISEFGLEKNCVLHGRVGYGEAMKLASEFDVCLSTSSKVIDGEDYCLASKTFDYLMLRKPVLAFVTKGSHREFLKSSGIAFLCDPDNITASAAEIDKLLKRQHLLKYNREFLSSFSRKEGARKLSLALDEITGHSK